MAGYHRNLLAAAGTALAAVGGLWGSLGPAQALAGSSNVIWLGRLALVAGIAAVLGAALVLRDRVPAGSAVALTAGIVLLGTGQAGAGIVVVLGATLTLGVGEKPEYDEIVENLRNAVP